MRLKKKSTEGATGSTRTAAAPVARVRTLVARVVWIICVVAALLLAVGALLIAVDANRDNSLVQFVLDGAKTADLNIFSRDNGIVTFESGDVETKNALVNWGLGAIAWLVVGRLLDRVIRP